MAPTGGQYQFNSQGATLHEAAAIEAVNVFNHRPEKQNPIDLIFPHTSSPRQWAEYGEMVGVAEKIYPISRETGNIVTASIPAGISIAAQQGVLKKKQSVLGWQGSAGMAFAAMEFNF
jgi:3-oxoacyl-[acyl-carrier-protein] synthase III